MRSSTARSPGVHVRAKNAEVREHLHDLRPLPCLEWLARASDTTTGWRARARPRSSPAGSASRADAGRGHGAGVRDLVTARRLLELVAAGGLILAAIVLILALPSDVRATNLAHQLHRDSQVATAFDVRVTVHQSGRAGTEVSAVTAIVSTSTGTVLLRLTDAFEASDLAPGQYPAAPESRYSPPLLVRYSPPSGRAMAEADYLDVQRQQPVRTDLILLSAGLTLAGAAAYLRFKPSLRHLLRERRQSAVPPA